MNHLSKSVFDLYTTTISSLVCDSNRNTSYHFICKSISDLVHEQSYGTFRRNDSILVDNGIAFAHLIDHDKVTKKQKEDLIKELIK